MAEECVLQTRWGRAGLLCKLSFPISATEEPSLNVMIEIIRKLEFATLIQEAFLLACIERTAAFQFEL